MLDWAPSGQLFFSSETVFHYHRRKQYSPEALDDKTNISRLLSCCFHSGSTFLVCISVLSSFAFSHPRILYHIAWTILPIAGSREPSLGFISLTQLLLKTTVHPKLSHRIYILRLQNMCFCFCTEINYRSGAPERYVFSLFRILRKWWGGGDWRRSPYPSVLHTFSQGMEDQYNRNTPVNVPRSLPRRFFKTFKECCFPGVVTN